MPGINQYQDSWTILGHAHNFASRKVQLKHELMNHPVAKVLLMKREYSFLYAMSQPTRWFKLLVYIYDFKAVGVMNRCREGDAGLGNRHPSKHGVLCPLCLHDGVMVKLNEEHVIAVCLAVSYDRDALGIGAYFHANC